MDLSDSRIFPYRDSCQRAETYGKAGLRKETNYAVPGVSGKRELSLGSFAVFVSLVAAFSLFCGYAYFIIPPLIVTFTEIVNSKAGFRNRPMQVFLFW